MAYREIAQATRNSVAIVLAGGRGQRLKDLTRRASKPGLDFGGKYKIIDFTLSNCVNSGFRRMMVATQYNSHRLLEHMQFGWTFLPEKLNEFVHMLPAQQSLEKEAWYSGTADAVFQNLTSLKEHAPSHILILAGDHIYKMDYRLFMEDHLNFDADMTLACLEVPRASATGFGVAQVNEAGRIVGFVEKPKDPPGIPGRPDHALASMGIYLVKADFLFEQLLRDATDHQSSHDFGKDLIPYLVPRAKVFAHRFERSHIKNLDKPAYWRDVGTLDSYWEANIELTWVDPPLDLYDYSWPIFTHQEQLPSAKFVHSDYNRAGTALSSLVSAGCIISGAMVRQSLLSNKVHVHSHALLEESVILPEVDIGRRARLRRVIVDRGVRIPADLVVGEDPQEDARRFCRTENGITLVSQRMLDRLQS